MRKAKSGKRKGLRARVWLVICVLATFALSAFADVSVTASVDQRRVAFGESVTLTIAVNGARNAPQPALPKVDGLNFAGPSVSTSMSWINGKTSESVTLTYQVQPTRTGEFTIPAIIIEVGGIKYSTLPIQITVEKGAPAPDTQERLFGKIRFDSRQVYLGQTLPLDIIVFARQDVPLKGFNGFQAEADGLGFKNLQNIKSGARVINGETFNLYQIEGAISPTKPGQLAFGPCVIKTQVAVQRGNRRGAFDDPFFGDIFGRVEVREVPVTIDAVPIEVLPLPEEDKPADFAGAVGQWKLEADAKPTEVAVGDPITLTIKISGDGNIDTVPMPKLAGLDDFKTYDPTSKTTKNELSTQGTKEIQQVLVAKSTDANQLPEVRFSYFDPAAKQYKTAVRDPIKLAVKAGGGGQSKIVSGGLRLRPQEKLGQDLVYLKGDIGTVPATISAPVFWSLNLVPVLGLLGGIVWKRRTDKLRGDVAYARRSRAARKTRKSLDAATGHEQIQRALQEYLGDRLNIPASGITASIVEERKLPGTVGEIFEACDAARFAGAQTDVAALKQKVEQVIDELETKAKS